MSSVIATTLRRKLDSPGRGRAAHPKDQAVAPRSAYRANPKPCLSCQDAAGVEVEVTAFGGWVPSDL